MTVKEYKDLRGLSNRELTLELKKVQPGLDEPLVSRLVTGLVEPSEELSEYINKAADKVFAIASEAIFGETGTSYRPADLTALESSIFDRLSEGTKFYPITRHELCVMTGLSDRMVRRSIENIRRKGGRVCTSSRHYGYWIARNPEDYQMLRAEYMARIGSLVKTVRAMDSVLAGQITWDEPRG